MRGNAAWVAAGMAASIGVAALTGGSSPETGGPAFRDSERGSRSHAGSARSSMSGSEHPEGAPGEVARKGAPASRPTEVVELVIASSSLVGVDPNDFEGLLETIRSSPDTRKKVWAIFHLVNRFGVDAEAAAVLASVLSTTDDPALLAAALWGLSRSEDPDAAATAGQLAFSLPEAPSRLEAVRTLGSLGTDEAAAILREILASDPDESVREEAAVFLGLVRSDDPAALAALLSAALLDTSTVVRQKAIEGLSASGLSEADLALSSVATSGVEEGERSQASEALETREILAEASSTDLTPLFAEHAHPLATSPEVQH